MTCHASSDASRDADEVYGRLSSRWFDKLLGGEQPERPTSYHVSWLRRLSPLEATIRRIVRPRSVSRRSASLFDLSQEPNIRLDLDDRPQKSPRACVIAADPPKIVHLITRAQGGLHDYQAFLHEAGHALHYGNCDPELPYTFRNLSRDHALTEIYSYIFEAISRKPAWHAEYFDLSAEQAEENAEATVFLEALLFAATRRAGFELEFWGGFGNGGGAGADEYLRLLRRRPESPTAPMRISRTWTQASIPPTTSGPEFAPPSCGSGCCARSARIGGAAARPATTCALTLLKGRSRPARRSRAGSASTHTTLSLSSPSWVPDVRFDRFYRYDELTEILRGRGAVRPLPPRLDRLVVRGREIWLCALTNFETGLISRSRRS